MERKLISSGSLLRAENRLFARGARGSAYRGLRHRADRAKAAVSPVPAIFTAKPNAASRSSRKPSTDAGGKREHIVRTRMFLKDMKGWEEAGRAHGEFFKDIRPASTMIQIVQAIDPAWLMEIEADAIVM